MPNYSVEKLRLFFNLAQARVVRADAQEDLRFLTIMRCAFGSPMDNKSIAHYKKTHAMLMAACNFNPNATQDVKANVGKVAERLTRMGAKRRLE